MYLSENAEYQLRFIVESNKQYKASQFYIDEDVLWELLKRGMVTVDNKIGNDIFVRPTDIAKKHVERQTQAEPTGEGE